MTTWTKKLETMGILEGLGALAERVMGMKYGSKCAQKILDRGNWPGVWPVVGRGGLYTGCIIESEEDYANLDDMAMVAIWDLKSSIREDGYCILADILGRSG